MSATRDGKMWRCQFYYKDWQGVSHKKNKRGFKTKAEAEQWERDFLQQQQRNLDINFENFVQIYYEDMEHRLRENTISNTFPSSVMTVSNPFRSSVFRSVIPIPSLSFSKSKSLSLK